MSGVFISYVKEDSDLVVKLSSVLELNGISVWLDREQLTPGMRWKNAISQAIRDGTFFLSVHSQARAKRDKSYVNEELATAIEEIRLRPMSKPWLIPLKTDDFDIEPRPIGGGETLLDLQYCDLTDWDSGLIRLMKVLGVKEPQLSASTGRKKYSQSEFVAPSSTVEDVLYALNHIAAKHEAGKVLRKELNKKFGRRPISDLSTLGLLQSDLTDGTVRLINPYGDQKFSLAAAVASQTSFKVAISVLQEDINASTVKVGKAVSDALDRDWTSASIRRNGQAIRKWVFLLYPNLRKPQLGDKAYIFAQNLEPKRTKRGAAPYVTREILERIVPQVDGRATSKKVAEILGLSSRTISKWRSDNPGQWDEIFPPQ